MFAIEKKYKDVGGAGHFHVWGGMRVNTFSLNVPERGLVGMTFGFMGSSYENGTTAYATSPAATATEPKATNLSIKDVKIDGVTLRDRSCVTAFTFEANNNMEVEPCLFDGLYGGKLLSKVLDMSGTLNLAYNPASQELLDKQLTGETVAITATIGFETGGEYTLEIPKAQISGDLPSGGKDRLDAALTYTVVSEDATLDAPTLTRVA